MIKWIITGLLFLTVLTFAQNSPHGKRLQFDCGLCHVPTSWKISNAQMNFNHSITGFELTGRHKIAECRECHKDLVFERTSAECKDCHSEPHQNTLGKDCASCHTTMSWTPINIKQIHNRFRFSLAGVHDIPDCQSCHSNAKNFIYSGAPVDCFSCHQTDYRNTTNPQHAMMAISTNCDQCHSLKSAGWIAEKFVHVTISLKGPHGGLTCNQCHTTGHVTQQCFDCHQKDFNAATDPNHMSSKFDHNCLLCHSSDSWIGAKFDHTSTGFPLTGAHITVSCSQCHTKGYQGTPAACISCHQSDYNRAENHLAQGYPKTCEQCHNTNSWEGADFNHASTRFPLTGAHLTVTCSQCHSAGYQGTSTNCVDCHQSDFSKTTNPNHTSAGISNDCVKCHSSAGWIPSSFSHASTGFELAGAHIKLQCSDCHKGSTAGLKTDCFSCHQNDFDRADAHAARNFPHECLQCHNMNNWAGANFDHSKSSFPLTGAHTNVPCQNCHQNGYQGISAACFSCHQASFNNAVNPNHQAAGISNDCVKCHTTQAWIPSMFSHASTGFTLTGAHLKQQCSSCHKGTTSGLQSDCFSCHQSDYNRAENHLAQGYPKTCEQCHNTNSWEGADFNHSATNFPLTGAHTAVNCSQCHSSGFKGTSTICFNCHQNNYNNTSNPRHAALSIQNTCESCHSTNPGWKPAQFPNHNSFFILDGAHAAKASDCFSCHKGNYNSTANTCYGCHQTDFDNTSNPPHKLQGFPQDCVACHTTLAWQPASYKNHDGQFFPIYSGSHRGRWNTCGDCHTVVTNFKVFECINCHEHSQSNTDSRHREVRNYLYKSTECYRCHPTGRGDGIFQSRSF